MESGQQTAASANPGTIAAAAELDNENGFLVYSVSFNSGLDVKVDAGTGQIVHT
ncbi:MAG: PepSY domain-containing protein [Spirochaetes bacterium]|nr:PepSY domain-containing protein [Spirochaetota bacterium]